MHHTGTLGCAWHPLQDLAVEIASVLRVIASWKNLTGKEWRQLRPVRHSPYLVMSLMRETDRHTYRQTDRQTDRYTDTDRQRHSERQTERDRDKVVSLICC